MIHPVLIKIFIVLAAALLGICVFALSGGAFIFSVLLLRKNAENPPCRKNVSAEQAQRENLLSAHLRDERIEPVWTKERERWNAELAAGNIERVSIAVKGRLILRGYVALPPKNARSDLAVILVHGYTDCASGVAYLADEYLKRGAAVLSIDCRAHGESDGGIISMGYLDSKDLPLWVDFLVNRLGAQTRIVLHGVSMGAAAVMLFTASKRFESERFSAVIADCGFSSNKQQFLNMAELIAGASAVQKFVCKILFAGMSVINFVMTGFFLFQNSPAHALKKRRHTKAVDVPLVLFHGSRDMLVRADMLDALVQAAGGKNVTVEKVEGAPHMGSYFYAPKRYMDLIFSK